MNAVHSTEEPTMKAGRELDALVAEKVMGWTGVEAEHHPVPGRAESDWFVPSGIPPEGARRKKLPYYSTDIAAAWEVVEKCGLSIVQSEDGWYAVQAADIMNALWTSWNRRIALITGDNAPIPLAETAPLAICLVALKSVESSFGEPPA